MNEQQYETAKQILREHFKTCNCFLPNISCDGSIEFIKNEASEYYLYEQER